MTGFGPSAISGTPRRRYLAAVVELGHAQKTSKGAPAYSRYVNRWLGRRLAAAAFVAGRTPNQVTAMSAALTYGAIALLVLAQPTVAVACVIASAFVLGYALDAADGQLARLQSSGTSAGEWLDHVVDAGKTSILHLAVLVSWYRFADLSALWLLVPIGFQAVSSIFFFSVTLTDQLRRAHRGGTGMFLAGEGTSSLAYSLAVVPTDYGVLCLLFFLLAWPFGFVAGYSLLFAANAVFTLLALPKWYREIRRYGRE